MKVYTVEESSGAYSDYTCEVTGVFSTLEAAQESVTNRHSEWKALHEIEPPAYKPERPTWEADYTSNRSYSEGTTWTIQEWEVEVNEGGQVRTASEAEG